MVPSLKDGGGAMLVLSRLIRGREKPPARSCEAGVKAGTWPTYMDFILVSLVQRSSTGRTEPSNCQVRRRVL